MPFKDSNGTCMLMPSVKRLPSVYTPCVAVEKKRPSGLRPIVKVYLMCVRPILEYACEAWHNNLPVYLSKQIEQIQKRALRIIFLYLQSSDAHSQRSIVVRSPKRPFASYFPQNALSRTQIKLACSGS
jgi:hypothetical protein